MIVDFFNASVLGIWLNQAGITEPQPPTAHRSFPAFVLQPEDRDRDDIIDDYLERLAQQGLDPSQQGLWFQSEHDLLINHQGHQRQTPASLTKAATTLAALKTWGPRHQFQTHLFTTGPIQSGVLEGDLIVQAEGDPLWVTPEVIALGNQLNHLGLHRVTGDLIVQGALAVNFNRASAAGGLLKQIWHSPNWTDEIQQAYTWMPKGTAKPEIVIEGQVMEGAAVQHPAETPLLSHTSLPLVDLLKDMNVFSNNEMAQWLTDQIGGVAVLRATALQTGRIAPQELILKNGSGLEQENQLSPRAVVGLFQAIQAALPPNLTLADLFPVAGQDKGTVEQRHLPNRTIVKTGTLWNTSGLAGVISTQRYGPVWFAIMNRGDDYTDGFRKAQDQLLTQLVKHWRGAIAPPTIGSVSVPIDPQVTQRHQAIQRFMQNNFLSH